MTETSDVGVADVCLERLTARGAGGIAVVAVRGPGRADLVAAWLRPVRAPLSLSVGSPPQLAELWLQGEWIDTVLVVIRAATIELQLHGSRAVVARLAAELPLLSPTLNPAERLATRALARPQLELALEQLALDWSRWLRDLCELAPPELQRQLTAARARSKIAMAMARPEKVVLVGAQNAGKSTLMNRLLFAERALTGPRGGTTRDPVRAHTALAGYPYQLIDTAGEGPSASALDQRALERGRHERAGTLRLLVVDGARGPDALDLALRDPRTLVVKNKIDLPQAAWRDELRPRVEVSCRDPAAAPAVRQAVGEALRRLRGLPPAGPVGGVAALAPEQLSLLEHMLAEQRGC